MYVRKENIEEEHLDWSKYTNPSKDEQDKTSQKMKEEPVHVPAFQQKKSFLNNRAKMGRKFHIKSKLTDLFNQNAEISLILSIIFLPYIVGFLISYFLYFFYGGISIMNFFSIQEAPSTIELWSIGAYLFITVGAVLAFFAP